MKTKSKHKKRSIIWIIIGVAILSIRGCIFWAPGRIAEAIVLRSLTVGQSRESILTLLRVVGASQKQKAPGIVWANFLRNFEIVADSGDRLVARIDRNNRVKSWRIEQFTDAI
jgi:hypothetical protein